MVSSLVVVASGVLALSAWLLLLHHVSPPSTAKRTTAISSPFGLMLSPLPPRGQADGDDAQREEYNRQPEDQVELLGCDRQRAVLGQFRPDADQVFIRRQPVD